MSDKFRWIDAMVNGYVCVPSVREIAVYKEGNAIVIRQFGGDGTIDDDGIIHIPPEYIEKLMKKLQEVKEDIEDYQGDVNSITIIKPSHADNSATISNDYINDQNLKWNDLGLLTYLLSRPGTWSINVEVLVQERGIGRDAIYGMLKRLRDAGYAKFIKNSDGTTEWTFKAQR